MTFAEINITTQENIIPLGSKINIKFKGADRKGANSHSRRIVF